MFEGNRFSGSLPVAWGAMRALQVLDVRGMCGVCGPVPFKQGEPGWPGALRQETRAGRLPGNAMVLWPCRC